MIKVAYSSTISYTSFTLVIRQNICGLLCCMTLRNVRHSVAMAALGHASCRRYLHCALSLVAQCIVIGPVCNGRAGGVCGFVSLLPR